MEILPQAFKKILVEGRPPSPLIVEGARAYEGAQEILRFILCEKRSRCGDCAGCKKVERDFHPDWIQLPEAYKLDDIREALMKLRQMPFEASHRVLIVPGLNSQKIQIQNALLKTLEEPSPRWILILSVESRWSLLETIRSRCLILHLSEISTTELDDSEASLFRAIEGRDEFKIYNEIEIFMKDRSSAKGLFQRLLSRASEKRFPGAWRDLAPHLEESLWDLNRNLHQKILWDRAWTRSLPPA